ncbi:MAG: MarR family transcriptional regulator [Thiovulaceae bacterium]|nr:MarR family transcriptional regulator [Sulfurimonadaceae bacterium]
MEYELRNSLGFRISLVANRVHAMFTRGIEPYGIAPEQFAAMKIISEDSETNQSKIAEMLGKGKPTVSRTLDVLEKKGLVSRGELETDRRAKRIRLTDEGEAVLHAVIPCAKAFNDAIRERLEPQEIESFFKVLETILETVDQYDTRGEKENDE